jgi:hypothetical protein
LYSDGYNLWFFLKGSMYHLVFHRALYLFLYTYPLCHIIKSYSNIGFHFYDDDTQIYFLPSGFTNLQNCLQDIQKWINNVKLKLNPGKTELFLFGSVNALNKIERCFPVEILGHQLLPVNKVCNLSLICDISHLQIISPMSVNLVFLLIVILPL